MGARSTGSHPTTTKSDGHLLEYFRQNFGAGGGAAIPVSPSGLTATGGVISDYTDSGTTYRAHVFTSSGTFTVSQIGTFGSTVDYLVVGGGGAGGNAHGSNATGGGGAGGLRTNMPACPYAQAAYPVSTAAPYTVTVGGGGVCNTEPGYSRAGTHSEIYPTPGGSGSGIYASGGGAGVTSTYTPDPEADGGSGGGEDTYDSDDYIGSTVASPDGRSPTTQGFAGGSATPSPAIGGGGGGAGEAGNTDGQGYGGDGLQILIAEPPATPAPTRTVGADGGYFAGGGGGNHGPSGSPGTSKPGGLGGGGGNSNPGGGRGTYATGGGGGGSFSATPGNILGQGGSGIVVIRYKIAETLSAKATGGVISFYGGKTIHTFTSSGTFATTSDWSNDAIEYVVVGGGGGGGGDVNPGARAGGGGAGGYLTGPATVGTHPNTITVTVGAGGLAGPGDKPSSNTGNSMPGNDSGLDFSNASQTDQYAAGGGRGAGGPSFPGPGYYGAHAGGSGGGGNGYTGDNANDPGAGNTYPVYSPRHPAPAPGQGNAGGSGPGAEPYDGGSGGGGAGGAGVNAPASAGSNGGRGIQIPTTFHDPISGVGKTGHPGSDNYYVAGGGGGGTGSGDTTTSGGAGPSSGGPYAGGGSGSNPDYASMMGASGTGGGGGGGGTNGNRSGGQGGSGIVLIAYPT